MQRPATKGLSLFGVAIILLIAGVSTARAVVEKDWPPDQPNTPKHADDLFLDFESGIDGIQIESSIPSVKFTTTSGLNWRYGDIRTDNYNVYPYGDQAYETGGNFFAWLGTLGDVGRIDFLGGGASYCSVLVSTSSGLTVDAYDGTDTKIATSGWADANTGTRTFTRLTVDAPAGKTIAYVLIHDTGNFWLIDDLCTDANKAVIPVPGRSIGNHGDKFDIVFIPDADYGSAADVNTWQATFLDHIDHQIDERLDGAAPVTGNLCEFNFYYTKMQGVASSKTLPTDLSLVAPFADAFVLFHNTEFGDSTSMGTPSIYGAEGPVGRSFIHESGHGIFGLADEYDGCGTSYFQPNPMPNIWGTEADGRADASSQGWNPDDIQKFTNCQGDWWKLGTGEFIMFDGTRFANGWGTPAERRIQWFLDQLPACVAKAAEPPPTAKSIWLKVQVSADVFSLVDESFVVEASPNYFPGKHEFVAKVFSNGGALVGEYGIGDPRRIQAESGYSGPTWLDTANFQLIVPYFESCGRVDLIESATGSVKLSVDISQYATVLAPQLACKDVTVAADPAVCTGTVLPGALDDGSIDPGGDPITFSLSPPGPYPGGSTPVTLTGCAPSGACGACQATITVNLPLGRAPDMMRFLDAKLGQDFLRVHGRIAPCTPLEPSLTPFEVELRNAGGVIYHATLPAGAIQKVGSSQWSYRDRSASLLHNGIRDLRLVYSPRRQQYDVRLHTFGDLSLATMSEMTLEMRFGSLPFAITKTWTPNNHGWQLKIH